MAMRYTTKADRTKVALDAQRSMDWVEIGNRSFPTGGVKGLSSRPAMSP